jgi:hypothetical protein
MTEAPFQLGVSRSSKNKAAATANSGEGKKGGKDEVLRPLEDAVSWSGSSSSSDLLF